jgi:hypothetical protein
MPDDTNTTVEVPPNTKLNDSLQAAARYVGVIITAVIAIVGLLGRHDVVGLLTFVQSNGGEVFIAVSGLISLGTAAYGIFKTGKRGGQLETAAADPRNEGVSFK